MMQRHVHVIVINKSEDVGSADLRYVAAPSWPTVVGVPRSAGVSAAVVTVGWHLVACAVRRTLHFDNQEFCIILRLDRLRGQCG